MFIRLDGEGNCIGVSAGPQPDWTEVADDDPRALAYLHPEGTVDGARAAAVLAIDGAAETARLRYITPGAGQALTYLEKERDARAYAAAGYPSGSLAQYPWVDAERQATGQTGREAADTIIATADAWRAKGAEIDGARRAGKLAVEAAADVPEIEAARDAALAELEGM